MAGREDRLPFLNSTGKAQLLRRFAACAEPIAKQLGITAEGSDHLMSV